MKKERVRLSINSWSNVVALQIDDQRNLPSLRLGCVASSIETIDVTEKLLFCRHNSFTPARVVKKGDVSLRIALATLQKLALQISAVTSAKRHIEIGKLTAKRKRGEVGIKDEHLSCEHDTDEITHKTNKNIHRWRLCIMNKARR